MLVEVWTYPPGSLSRGDAVDSLSLHLSLRDPIDDRVARARDDLLAVLGWFRDSSAFATTSVATRPGWPPAVDRHETA